MAGISGVVRLTRQFFRTGNFRRFDQNQNPSSTKERFLWNQFSRQKMSFSNKANNEYVEGIVCDVNEIEENQLKTVELGEGQVLLVKQKGVISALGTKCTHFNAPLVKGALGDGRVRCPWHGACFNILNGDIEDYPGLDSLPCYKVTIEDDKVKVRAKKSDLKSNRRMKEMSKKESNNNEHFVVVGGGPSGAVCVETLRQEGFKGEITLVCKENYLPYDRIRVSKNMDMEMEKIMFRDESFYKANGINVLKGVAAIGLQTDTKKLNLSNGNSLNYDKIYIATGCIAKKLQIPGWDLKNVVVLREYDDSSYTYSQLSEDKEVVILGSSFIANEAAAFCLDKVKKVTVVFRNGLPFQPFLGPEVGEAFLKFFQSKGIEYILNSGLKEIQDDGQGNVTAAVLIDDTILKADLVIMGIGSDFATDFLKNSGVEIRADGTIETNEYLESNVENVFIGGDIAHAPVWSNDNEKFAIGHFPLAQYHGKIAAKNMLGRKMAVQSVPFFWTMIFGKRIQYAGHGDYDEIIYHGNPAQYAYVAFYLKDEIVVATSSCGMDPIVSQWAEFASQGKKLTKNDLMGEDKLAWTKGVVPLN